MAASDNWKPTPQQRAGISLGVYQVEQTSRAQSCRWVDTDDFRQEALIRLWLGQHERPDLSPFTRARNAARWAGLKWLQQNIGSGASSRGREQALPEDYDPDQRWVCPDDPEAFARVHDAYRLLGALPQAMLQALEWEMSGESVAEQARAAGVNPQVAWHRVRNSRDKLEAVLLQHDARLPKPPVRTQPSPVKCSAAEREANARNAALARWSKRRNP